MSQHERTFPDQSHLVLQDSKLMLGRKKILVNKTEFKGITAGISSVIQPQDCDKHDDSFDQNIDKVVDLLPGPSRVSPSSERMTKG